MVRQKASVLQSIAPKKPAEIIKYFFFKLIQLLVTAGYYTHESLFFLLFFKIKNGRMTTIPPLSAPRGH